MLDFGRFCRNAERANAIVAALARNRRAKIDRTAKHRPLVAYVAFVAST